MGAIFRFFIRLTMLLLAVVLAMAAAGAYLNGQKSAAVGMGAVSLLLLLMRGRKKSPIHWRNDPATDRQRTFASELGIKHRSGMTKGQLSDLIDQKLSEQ